MKLISPCRQEPRGARDAYTDVAGAERGEDAEDPGCQGSDAGACGAAGVGVCEHRGGQEGARGGVLCRRECFQSIAGRCAGPRCRAVVMASPVHYQSQAAKQHPDECAD